MKKPNFFIIGAPKCGTTSLAAWLAEHPRIFMPSRKEINFFNTDHKRPNRITFSEYNALFSNVPEDITMIGEASVWYLYSFAAIKNILEYANNPRLFVCIRNPIEMSYSLFLQQRYNMNENLSDFHTAWGLSTCRSNGEYVTRDDVEPSHLDYASVCCLGEQLERLYEIIEPRRVHIIFLEDMEATPIDTYNKAVAFLGLGTEINKHFPTMNKYKVIASPLLKRTVINIGNVKRALRIRKRFGFLQWLNKKNTLYKPKPNISPILKSELSEYFKEDIKKLEYLTTRDLSHWL